LENGCIRKGNTDCDNMQFSGRGIIKMWTVLAWLLNLPTIVIRWRNSCIANWKRNHTFSSFSTSLIQGINTDNLTIYFATAALHRVARPRCAFGRLVRVILTNDRSHFNMAIKFKKWKGSCALLCWNWQNRHNDLFSSQHHLTLVFKEQQGTIANFCIFNSTAA
jgi:hypothetical protein